MIQNNIDRQFEKYLFRENLLNTPKIHLDITNNGIFIIFNNNLIYDDFLKDLKNITNSERFINSLIVFHKLKIFIHNFFIIEFSLILYKLGDKYKSVYNDVINKTWLNYGRLNKIKLNKSKYKQKFKKFELRSYQKGFLDIYTRNVNKYNLLGYILSFEQGLGKTLTALALMESLNKRKIIIICPKSIIYNVWVDEINKFYSNKQKIWTLDGNNLKDSKIYIINYNSVHKLPLNEIKFDLSVGFIIDESHNLRNFNGSIFKNILTIIDKYKNRDVLCMSGTPIKAMGKEIIPLLFLIDPFFKHNTAEKFIEVYKFNTILGKELLQNRIGMITYRKLKKDVVKLPAKHYEQIKIKLKDGEKYTLDSVKKQILDFIIERKEYYNKEYDIYSKMFDDSLEYFKNLKKSDEELLEFNRYLKIINNLKKKNFGWEPRWSDRIYNKIKWANTYEKEIIYPSLSSDFKKKFKESKAVVKYVDLKIEGEYLGGLLNNLRSNMFSEIIQNSNINEIVNKSNKKTICFSMYLDVINVANNYFIYNNFNPLIIKGDSDVKSVISDFRNDLTYNPLIASIKKISVGVTLIEANTIIFLSPPWRDADKKQAEDRVHRIGQNEDVFIYDLLLDTGNDKNLSTRMNEIIEWSGKMVKIILNEI